MSSWSPVLSVPGLFWHKTAIPLVIFENRLVFLQVVRIFSSERCNYYVPCQPTLAKGIGLLSRVFWKRTPMEIASKKMIPSTKNALKLIIIMGASLGLFGNSLYYPFQPTQEGEKSGQIEIGANSGKIGV